MHRIQTCLLIVLLLAPCASAREIFVDNVGGDDRNNGSSPKSTGAANGPCRSIAQALKLAVSEDHIVLANSGVPYRESITLQAGRHSGTARKPTVLVGNGAILDGSWPVPEESWQHYQGNVFRFRPRRTSFQQLFRDDRPLPQVRIDNGTLKLPKLEPLQWCLFQGYIYFRVEKDKLPQYYNITHSGDTGGITLYEVRHVIIADVIVQGYQLDGINAHDSVFNTTLVGVICRGNGRSGISIGGASRVVVEEAIVGDNGAAQVRTEGYSRTQIVNCEVIGNTAPAVVREGGEVVIDGEVMTEDVRRENIVSMQGEMEK